MLICAPRDLLYHLGKYLPRVLKNPVFLHINILSSHVSNSLQAIMLFIGKKFKLVYFFHSFLFSWKTSSMKRKFQNHVCQSAKGPYGRIYNRPPTLKRMLSILMNTLKSVIYQILKTCIS